MTNTKLVEAGDNEPEYYALKGERDALINHIIGMGTIWTPVIILGAYFGTKVWQAFNP